MRSLSTIAIARVLGPLLALVPNGFAQSWANDDAMPSIGRMVDAPFVDRYWQERRLAELRRHRAVVVYFATVECPMVSRTLPKLARLVETWPQDEVALLVVHLGATGKFVEAVGHTTLMVPRALFAWDPEQRVATACGVVRTNTAVILDRQGRMRYRGRVDGAGYAGPGTAVASHDLGDAVARVRRDLEPVVPESSVAGCLLTPPQMAQAVGGEAAPSYFTHIAPLMERACLPCHKDAEPTGVRLAVPADLAKHAAMLGEVVANGRMPPWFAASGDVPFVNQRSLTDGERAMVASWFRAGQPKGEEHYTLRHPSHDGWQLGTVDRILEVEQTWTIPESGAVDYTYAVLPERFPEDVWIEGLEVRTRSPRALRHCNVALVAGDSYDPSGWVANTTVHSPVWQAWPETGLRIPAGHRLALQAYYEPIGSSCQERLAVGLRFARSEVRREVRVTTFHPQALRIPSGDAAARAEASWLADGAGEGVGIFVHMHGRGRDVRVVHRQEGSERMLLWVPTYSFAMQSTYWWARGQVSWPAGSQFEAVAHFDNSADNPANPDPRVAPELGGSTVNEQFLVSVVWLPRAESRAVRVDPATGRARQGG